MAWKKGKKTSLTAREKMKRCRARKAEEDVGYLADKNHQNVKNFRERMSSEAKDEQRRKDNIKEEGRQAQEENVKR